MEMFRKIPFSGILIILLGTFSIQLTGAGNRQLCYTCQNIVNVTNCEDLHLCKEGEVCYAQRNAGNQTTFSFGCTQYSTCPGMTTVSTSTASTTVTTPSLNISVSNNVTTTSAMNTSGNSTAMTTPSSLKNLTGTTTILPIPTHANHSTSINIPTTRAPSTPTSSNTTLPPGGPVGRSIEYIELDDINDNKRCCYNDQCNLELFPEIVDNSTCRDKIGFQCSVANETFGICKRIHEAKTVCKKFCNLCNLVDGNWSEWSNFSMCDVTCGNGTQVRTRNCSNPAPENGGLDCFGNDTDYETCFPRKCPVHGGWATWSELSGCSATCGVGLQSRYRNCSDPFPGPDGHYCFGSDVDEKVCFKDYCEDGVWTMWTNWTECSRTCGPGIKQRHRNCSTTSPFARPCSGEPSESQLCNEKLCGEGKWSTWSSWSDCSRTCGPGIRHRHRNCSFTDLSSTPCQGDSSEFQTCNPDLCSETEASAFSLSGRPHTVPGTNTTLTFVNVITNVGGDFNITTGLFTARIAGLYEFFVTIEKQVQNGEAHCQLMHNDKSILTIAARSVVIDTGSYQQASNMVILHLKPDDVVFLGRCTSSKTMSETSTFSGILVQKD